MRKGHADFFAPGDYNAVCYTCGGKFKASELKKQWQGYYTCPQCWEPRHPQDFVKGIADNMSTPWSQPQPSYSFASVPGGFTTNYSPVFADSGTTLVHPASDTTARTVSLTSTFLNAVELQSTLQIVNMLGAGNVTITAPGAHLIWIPTLANGNRTLIGYGTCIITKVSKSSWTIYGNSNLT